MRSFWEFAVNFAQERYFSCAVHSPLRNHIATIKQILGYMYMIQQVAQNSCG